MLETRGPAPTFADAVLARDLNRAGALLSAGVRLAIPPLHYTRDGVNEVLDAFARLLDAFGELRYDVRSRYLAPSSVVDEAVIVGRQTGAFLGAAPSRRVNSVPARVMIEHDATGIVRITIWPDLAALRATLAGVDRIIDLTPAGRTDGMIAALRATLPAREPRLIVSGPRELPPPVLPSGPERPATPPPAGPLTGAGREVPRAPVPKSVRRRRAVLASGTMLVIAGALASWVAVGALNLPGTTSTSAGDSARRAEAARAAAAAGAGHGQTDPDGGTRGGSDGGPAGGEGGAGAPLAPAHQLASGRNTVIIGSDLLFATNSDRLTPQARRILADLIVQARRQNRPGTVTVSGYTDDVGSTKYNLSLSRRRAAVVAAVLRKGMTGTRTTLASRGHGEARPVASNQTPQGRQANRRVTVTFPPVVR